MGWQDLVEKKEILILPWFGNRQVASANRFFEIAGRLPPHFGWWEFEVGGGRDVRLVGREPADTPLDVIAEFLRARRHEGYLVGDRFIPVAINLFSVQLKTELYYQVHFIPPGVNRFGCYSVAEWPDKMGRDRLVFVEEIPGKGPEQAVTEAYEMGQGIEGLKGVPVGLRRAFNLAVEQRKIEEERRAAIEREREAERLREELRNSVGTGEGRRRLAAIDFRAAAEAALAVTGSRLLDAKPSGRKGEMLVNYLVQNRRLQCVVDAATLRIVDSGICLQDHDTGIKGDTWFTLESLPSVVKEAIARHKLVVWRHI